MLNESLAERAEYWRTGFYWARNILAHCENRSDPSGPSIRYVGTFKIM
jgi:hypothetical protein